MEAVITREILMLAYQRVVENKGAAGADNLSVAELKPWLKKNWRSVRQSLIDGNYQPRAIRQMDIPKPDGGVRTHEPPYAEPHVRWCERTSGVIPPPTRSVGCCNCLKVYCNNM